MDAFAHAEACVRVRLFAALRDSMGWSERLVTPPTATSTPLDLWHQLGLGADTRGAKGTPNGIRVAINQQFASWDAPLAAGDELAFLPPISGG
jgi:molybdopterin synthase sulfur carrier subunit